MWLRDELSGPAARSSRAIRTVGKEAEAAGGLFGRAHPHVRMFGLGLDGVRGHAQLETTVQALVGIEASHIKGITDASSAMGILNRIVGIGDMRLNDLAKAMSTGVAATATTFGLSITDLGAAMATLTDNTVKP